MRGAAGSLSIVALVVAGMSGGSDSAAGIVLAAGLLLAAAILQGFAASGGRPDTPRQFTRSHYYKLPRR